RHNSVKMMRGKFKRPTKEGFPQSASSPNGRTQQWPTRCGVPVIPTTIRNMAIKVLAWKALTTTFAGSACPHIQASARHTLCKKPLISST
ncbi:hypothetical protein E4U22_002509, partial [Claviceps purpurea]